MKATGTATPVKRRFTAKRRERLVQMAQDDGYISASDAAGVLDVSLETIRKDIIFLDEQGLLRRSHGGAFPAVDVRERPLAKKSARFLAEKRAIARCVNEMIPDGASVVLDAGSTVFEVAALLAQRSGLTIFTNSLVAIAPLASSENELFILGGHVRKTSGAIVGDWPQTELATIQADIAVIGADSASSPSGPSVNSYEEVAVKNCIVRASRTRILVADSSKLTTSGSFRMCPWDDLDTLVTNKGADASPIDAFVHIVTA